MKTIAFLAAAALSTAAVIASPAAFAETLTAQTAVSYSDLDLTSAGGKAELARRIDRAARLVCPTQQTTGTRIDQSSKCRADAKARVADQIARNTERNGLGG